MHVFFYIKTVLGNGQVSHVPLPSYTRVLPRYPHRPPVGPRLTADAHASLQSPRLRGRQRAWRRGRGRAVNAQSSCLLAPHPQASCPHGADQQDQPWRQGEGVPVPCVGAAAASRHHGYRDPFQKPGAEGPRSPRCVWRGQREHAARGPPGSSAGLYLTSHEGTVSAERTRNRLSGLLATFQVSSARR